MGLIYICMNRLPDTVPGINYGSPTCTCRGRLEEHQRPGALGAVHAMERGEEEGAGAHRRLTDQRSSTPEELQQCPTEPKESFRVGQHLA